MLRGLGINEQEELIYTVLLGQGDVSLTEITAATGLALSAVTRSLTRLRRLRLVTRRSGRPVRYAALSPEVGLGGLLVERQGLLQQAQERVVELLAAHRNAGGPHQSENVVEVITATDELAQCVVAMERSAREGAQIFVRSPYVLDTNMTMPETPQGVVNRFVYERDLLEDERTREEISVFLAADYQIRVTDALPTKLIIVDRQVALVPMLPDQGAASPGFLLLRGRAVVTALAELFDHVWARATPLRLTASGLAQEDVPTLDDTDMKLITLMLSGLPDKAVASQLGTSLRTVQRRLRQLMELTGTANRMQLGWYAARAGLV
ncbi:LuxR family transcriptional regulator [Streptomyces sannanensis]|uniref:LuxR family transcriptional regulator n=1 Tax=Streptomyces sannanensis TaxID=285536 RepID=A0ABP6S4R8_9ACTN